MAVSLAVRVADFIKAQMAVLEQLSVIIKFHWYSYVSFIFFVFGDAVERVIAGNHHAQ